MDLFTFTLPSMIILHDKIKLFPITYTQNIRCTLITDSFQLLLKETPMLIYVKTKNTSFVLNSRVISS